MQDNINVFFVYNFKNLSDLKNNCIMKQLQNCDNGPVVYKDIIWLMITTKRRGVANL